MKMLTRLFCLAMCMPAQQAAMAAPPFPLAGTWSLVAADKIMPDGSRQHDYGEAPSGLLMIDTDGRYMLQIYQQGRPHFTGGEKKTGTRQEFEAAVLGASTHMGTLSMDEMTHTLSFNIASAAFSNWEGTRQERRYELKGDELSYRVPVRPDGQIPVSVWRRVR